MSALNVLPENKIIKSLYKEDIFLAKKENNLANYHLKKTSKMYGAIRQQLIKYLYSLIPNTPEGIECSKILKRLHTKKDRNGQRTHTLLEIFVHYETEIFKSGYGYYKDFHEYSTCGNNHELRTYIYKNDESTIEKINQYFKGIAEFAFGKANTNVHDPSDTNPLYYLEFRFIRSKSKTS